MKERQHLYTCPDSECAVVVFVDRMLIPTADPAKDGTCPGDHHLTGERGGITVADEHLLFSYLDEYLNANGVEPHLAGTDATGAPFLAWLDEEGGDCVGLRVARLVPNDGGATESPTAEAPGQGQVSSLTYPVTILEVKP